jgi:hypothetical protein
MSLFPSLEATSPGRKAFSENNLLQNRESEQVFVVSTI